MAAARALSQRAVRARAPTGTRPSLGGEVRPSSAGPGAGPAEARPRLRPCPAAPPPSLLAESESEPRANSAHPLPRTLLFPSSSTVRNRSLLLEASTPLLSGGKSSVSLCPTRRCRCHFPGAETPCSDSIFPVAALAPLPPTWLGPPTPVPLIHWVGHQGRDKAVSTTLYGGW